MDQQLRLDNLIPHRLTTLALGLAAAMGVIALLEWLHTWVPVLSRYGQNGRVAALDLAAPASLAAWFCSLVLALSAVAALAVYAVRRHRVDDYQGQYRIWLWAATCWMILSADAVAGLHDGLRDLITQTTGVRMFGDGSIWWAIVYLFLFGAVAVRLLVEMREAPLSLMAFVSGCLVYCFAVVVQLHGAGAGIEALRPMVQKGAEMSAAVLVLATMMLQARRVLIDAEGSRPREADAEDADADDMAADIPVVSGRAKSALSDDESCWDEGISVPAPKPAARAWQSDGPHGAPPPSAFSSVSPAATPVPTIAAQSKLTKADRKALRRRLEQMRAEREKGI